MNYNSMASDTTNTYAQDPTPDKTFYDYVDDQYIDFHRNNTGKDMIGYIYPSKERYTGTPTSLGIVIPANYSTVEMHGIQRNNKQVMY